jgi:hypothetical protein
VGRGSIRRSWLLAAAAILAVTGNLAPVAAPPTLAASDALLVATTTTYTIQPARHVVRVVVDLTATNNKPNLTSGPIVTRYFFQSARIAVQPETRNVRATSGGSSLTSTLTPADGYSILEVRLPKNLYYHQTATLRLTFDLPGAAPRTKSEIRVGTAFATFVAWAFGDSGSVRIVVPAGFDAQTTGSALTRSTSGGATVFRASRIDDVVAWYAVVNADRPAGLTTDRIDLAGGEHLVIRAWPEDTEWRKQVSDLLKKGLPELVDLIGLDWPVATDLQVFEVHTPLLEGYAGVFFENQDKIEISEDLDDLTIIHEASHAWFNGDLFNGRWLDEGFADTYAARALDAIGIGGWFPDRVAPTDAAAVPLADWTHPGRIGDAATEAREHYGYEASWTVIRTLVDEIGADGMQGVLRAAKNRSIAYVGAPEPEKVDAAVDWRRFLDLVEEIGGSTTADTVMRRWVVKPTDAHLLEGRSVARTAYHGLIDAGHGWLPPAYVRVPMSTWDFSEAGRRISLATTVLGTRDRIAALVAPIGLDPPAALRTAYESASTQLEPVQELAQSELDSATALVAADAAVSAPRDTFVSIGLIGESPDAALVAARSAFQAGAPDAATRAAGVTALIAGAESAGQARVAVGIAAVLVLLFAIVVATVILRRRRARFRRAAAGPPSYATLPDQSIEPEPPDATERSPIDPGPDPSTEPPEERNDTS